MAVFAVIDITTARCPQLLLMFLTVAVQCHRPTTVVVAAVLTSVSSIVIARRCAFQSQWQHWQGQQQGRQEDDSRMRWMMRTSSKITSTLAVVGLPREGGVAGCDDDWRRRRRVMWRWCLMKLLIVRKGTTTRQKGLWWEEEKEGDVTTTFDKVPRCLWGDSYLAEGAAGMVLDQPGRTGDDVNKGRRTNWCNDRAVWQMTQIWLRGGGQCLRLWFQRGGRMLSLSFQDAITHGNTDVVDAAIVTSDDSTCK